MRTKQRDGSRPTPQSPSQHRDGLYAVVPLRAATHFATGLSVMPTLTRKVRHAAAAAADSEVPVARRVNIGLTFLALKLNNLIVDACFLYM